MKEAESANKISELDAKIERYEKQISNVNNLEMQIDSLQSEVKFKQEQAQKFQYEVYGKDTEL